MPVTTHSKHVLFDQAGLRCYLCDVSAKEQRLRSVSKSRTRAGACSDSLEGSTEGTVSALLLDVASSCFGTVVCSCGGRFSAAGRNWILQKLRGARHVFDACNNFFALSFTVNF